MPLPVETLLLGATTCLATGVAAWLGWRLQKAGSAQLLLEREKERLEQAQQSIASLEAESRDLQEKLDTARDGRSRAESAIESLKERLESLEMELQTARRNRDAAIDQLRDAEKQTALAHQEVQAMQSRMKDWEEQKAHSLQAAKASIAEVGAQLSNKLLADHKRESETAKKQSEEEVRKTTETLNTEFKRIIASVSSLNDQVQKNRTTVDKVWRALSTPSEAGHFAEIGLENTLKGFGLQAERDYHMQYTTGSGRLRPDAVLFLPQDTVLAVDAKSSIFLLEMAEAEGSDQSDIVKEKLKARMREHLRTLAGKDYKAAILQEFKEAGRGKQIRRSLNVMYLPNEQALEQIHRADPAFSRMAIEQDIILVGPTGLAGLVGLCRVEIDLAKQAENQEKIIDSAQDLLDSLITVLGHATSVGKGLKSASEHFSKFSNSVNARLLPRSRKLVKLGVRPSKSKPLPANIPSFSLHEEGHLIEAEMDEPTTPTRERMKAIPELEPQD